MASSIIRRVLPDPAAPAIRSGWLVSNIGFEYAPLCNRQWTVRRGHTDRTSIPPFRRQGQLAAPHLEWARERRVRLCLRFLQR